MEIAVTRDGPGATTFVVVRGALDAAGLIEAMRRDFETGEVRDVVTDLSEADLSDLDHEDLRRIAAENKALSAGRASAKSAIVVRGEGARLLAGLYQAIAASESLGTRLRIFETRDAASAWLAGDGATDG